MKKTNIKSTAMLLFSACALSLVLSQCSSSKNVTGLSSAEIQNMVNSSQFVFVADKLTPMRGTTRYLTNYYYLDVDKDNLNSFLPFLGRIYQPLLDPTKGPLRFTSTRFAYKVTPKNKSGWEVVIKPMDYPDVQELDFDIFDNGNANLSVLSTDRDEISFSGRIEKLHS